MKPFTQDDMKGMELRILEKCREEAFKKLMEYERKIQLLHGIEFAETLEPDSPFIH